MNQQNAQWIVIIILALGVFGLGTLQMEQSAQIVNIKQTVSSLSSPTQKLVQIPSVPQTAAGTSSTNGVIIAQKAHSGDGEEVYQFIQTCDGDVRVTVSDPGVDASVMKYCVGKNRFSVADSNGKIVLLDERSVTDPREAPLLLDVSYTTPGYASGTFLLSYSAEPCRTVDDCGAGMPNTYVTMAWKPGDSQSQALKNFPSSIANSVWNSSGTKMLFVPDTCGGAGCDMTSLQGYDLMQDTVTDHLTSVQAVGANETEKLNPMDVSGRTLGVWSNFGWTMNKGDATFIANYKDQNGQKKQVTGTF